MQASDYDSDIDPEPTEFDKFLTLFGGKRHRTSNGKITGLKTQYFNSKLSDYNTIWWLSNVQKSPGSLILSSSDDNNLDKYRVILPQMQTVIRIYYISFILTEIFSGLQTMFYLKIIKI